MTDDMAEHVMANREYWDDYAPNWVETGERAWAKTVPNWGVWGAANSDCPMLPDDMTGLDAIELGCGTGYVSAWMNRLGAKVVGIDNSEEQLKTARRLAAEHDGSDIEWIHGDAEAVPKPDKSFDFAISEYGAAIWCEPRAWITEAKRLLRPGGRLVFLGSSPLSLVCSPLNGAPADKHLHRSYFGIHKVDWRTVEIDPGGIEFNLTMTGWFELFRDLGFSVDDYREPRPASPKDEMLFSIPQQWAYNYPSEQVFWLTLR
ncbi:MAG: class I SAM-dependent methyltransferase [Actinobacteria bacterium]|nr:class I SAM-dependent methyltransferase [Actinomycetota bacterium]